MVGYFILMKLSLLYELKEIEMKRFELLDYEAFGRTKMSKNIIKLS